MSQLRVQFDSAQHRPTFNIHHFEPDWVRECPSSVGQRYDYVVLAHNGDNDNPVCLRMFFERAELIEFFDKIAPIVAAWRQPVSAIASAPVTPEETSEAPSL